MNAGDASLCQRAGADPDRHGHGGGDLDGQPVPRPQAPRSGQRRHVRGGDADDRRRASAVQRPLLRRRHDFLLFDVEIVLLWPWAILFYDVCVRGNTAAQAAIGMDKASLFGAIAIFFVILVVGYVYDWGRACSDRWPERRRGSSVAMANHRKNT